MDVSDGVGAARRSAGGGGDTDDGCAVRGSDKRRPLVKVRIRIDRRRRVFARRGMRGRGEGEAGSCVGMCVVHDSKLICVVFADEGLVRRGKGLGWFLHLLLWWVCLTALCRLRLTNGDRWLMVGFGGACHKKRMILNNENLGKSSEHIFWYHTDHEHVGWPSKSLPAPPSRVLLRRTFMSCLFPAMLSIRVCVSSLSIGSLLPLAGWQPRQQQRRRRLP